MSEPAVPYKIYNRTELDAVVRHVRHQVDLWLVDWFEDGFVAGVQAVNAYIQAQQTSRFFQKDTWLTAYNFSYLQGHCWALAQDKSMKVCLQHLLKTTSKIDLACRASRELCESSFSSLARQLLYGFPLHVHYPKFEREMLFKGSGWAVVEIHFSHWSFQLFVSPDWIKHLLSESDCTYVLPSKLVERPDAIKSLMMNLSIEIDTPAMSLQKLGELSEGDTIILHRRGEVGVRLKNDDGLTLCPGRLVVIDQKLSVELVKGA